MSNHLGETIILGENAGHSISAVRRGYELEEKSGREVDETIYTVLGEYAISDGPEGILQFVSAEEWTNNKAAPSESRYLWESAEELRTRTIRGEFLPEHMDMLDPFLFGEKRVTSADTKLTIASEEELRHILQANSVPLESWPATKVHDLFNYTGSNDPNRSSGVVEAMTLHDVDGQLWLSTAQTMLNVYYQSRDGRLYRLKETWKTIFDSEENPSEPKPSKIKSSMGETGHLINGIPERAWDTARRCLDEELGIKEDNVISSIISTGSLLRHKPRGHHQFGPIPEIAAEDWTHYFSVTLNPGKVEPTYINRERDADGNLRAEIQLEWFEVRVEA